MTYVLAPYNIFRAFDADGAPLAGGLLHTYRSGTTIPQAAYQTPSGTAHTNPIVLDANGQATVYLNPTQTYRFTLTDAAGVTQDGYPQDGIVAVPGTDLGNVLAYGADPTGATDSAAAIRAAVNAVYAAGGGRVTIPAGTYLLANADVTTYGEAYPIYVIAKDGVEIVGAGVGSTRLLVAAGQNLAYRQENNNGVLTNGPFVIGTCQASALQKVRYADFTVDWNAPYNNIEWYPTEGHPTNDTPFPTGVPTDNARNNAAFFSLHGALDTVIERVRVVSTPGNQCLFFPVSSVGEAYVGGVTTGAPKVGRITVRDCDFINSGSGLPDNFNLDHSSIYCNGDWLTYDNCRFTAVQEVVGTCFEIHGSHGKATNCKSDNYTNGAYLVGDFYAVRDILLDGNSHTNCHVAFGITSENFSVDQVKVSNCAFYQKAGLTLPNTTYFVNGYKMKTDLLQIDNSTFQGQGYEHSFMQVYAIGNLMMRGCRIENFGGTAHAGIEYAGTIPYTGSTLFQSLALVGNTFTDVHWAVYAYSPTNTGGLINIQGNTFQRFVTDAGAPVTLNLPSSKGMMAGNVYSATYTGLHLDGNPHGMVNLDQDGGTWDPVISGDGGTNGAETYSVQGGQWTRQGQKVDFILDLAWTGHTGTGAATISLPIVPAVGAGGVVNSACAMVVENVDYSSGASPVARIDNTGTKIYLLAESPASALEAIEVPAAASIQITGTFTAAS